MTMRRLLEELEGGLSEARSDGRWVKRKAHAAMSPAAAKRKLAKVHKGIESLRDEAKANAELYRQIAADWFREYEEAAYELGRYMDGHSTTDAYTSEKGEHQVRLASVPELKRSLGQAMGSEALRRAWGEAYENLEGTLKALDRDDVSVGETLRRVGKDPSEWGDYGGDPLGNAGSLDKALTLYRRSRRER